MMFNYFVITDNNLQVKLELKIKSFVLAFLLSSFVCTATQSLPPRQMTVHEIVQATLPSIVSITVRGRDGKPFASGSGFVVAENMVATNAHVVDSATTVTVNFQDGRSKIAAGIVSKDDAHDVAILFVATKKTHRLTFSQVSVQSIGESVVAIGKPEGLIGSVSTGIISGIRHIENFTLIQTTAPISPGSSGGALLDDHGRVVGITKARYIEGQNLNFAVPAEYIKQILPQKVVRYLPWDGSGWMAINAKPKSMGRLGVVLIEGATIYSNSHQKGRILSICPKGQYLSLKAQTATDYLVLMLDYSLGYIPKENVKVLDYQVIQEPTIGE